MQRSYLFLSLVSGIFLFACSVSGIILALEPISEEFNSVREVKNQYLNDFLPKLDNKYQEIFTLKINLKNCIEVSVLDSLGQFKEVVINPNSLEEINLENNRSNDFFDFFKKLHRSLFLKNTGRVIVGILSLILFLIAITGIFLIKKNS